MADYVAKIQGTFSSGLSWSTRFHLTGSASEAALSSAFNSAVTTLWGSGSSGIGQYFSTEVLVTGTLVSMLGPTMKQTTGTEAGLTLAGTAAVESMPFQTAPLISLRTPNLNRSGRGRAYLPPMAVSEVVNDKMVVATQTAVAADVRTFIGNVKAAGVQFFLFNQFALKDGTPPYTKTVVTTAEVSSKFATQRRRVNKVVPSYLGGSV